jgi:hypothetical protein
VTAGNSERVGGNKALSAPLCKKSVMCVGGATDGGGGGAETGPGRGTEASRAVDGRGFGFVRTWIGISRGGDVCNCIVACGGGEMAVGIVGTIGVVAGAGLRSGRRRGRKKSDMILLIRTGICL